MNRLLNPIKYAVINNNFKHKHVTQRMVDKVNTINMIQLLIWWDEGKIVYQNRQFLLKDNNHCVIYDDMVYNHYTGETFNPINALMAYFDLSFGQAFYTCNYFMYKVNKSFVEEYIEQRYKAPVIVVNDNVADLNHILMSDSLVSTIPDIKALALKRVYAYLCNTRHIDRDIVSNFIKRRLIALDGKNNLCFLTYRGDDVIAVTKKGTNPSKPFKQNLVKELHTAFFYAPKSAKNSYTDIYVFESCIDLMSFLTLVKRKEIERPPEHSCFITLNGVGMVYLDRVLYEHKEIGHIHLCLDNDSVGINATDKYIRYNMQRDITDMRPILFAYTTENGYVKDWNEMLCHIALNTPF